MQGYIQKKEGYGHLLQWLIRLCDLLLINAFFVVIYYVSVHYFEQPVMTYEKKGLALILVNLAYFIVAATIPLQTSTNIIYIERLIKVSTIFIILVSILTTIFFALFKVASSVNLAFWVASYVLLTSLYVLLHISIRLALKAYRRKGYNHKRVILVGAGDGGKAIYAELKGSDFGYKIKGYFLDQDVDDDEMPEYLGKVENLKEYVLKNKIDEIYCTLESEDKAIITDLIFFSERNMVRFYLVPHFFNYIKRRFVLKFVESVPVVSLRYEPMQFLSNRIIKRTFDLVFSLMVLTFIFPPILLVIGTLIKLSSPGPLFFKQERTGLQGKSFMCYKFRSMTVNKLADSQRAVKDDPRVTKVGAFIRKTSIDELPQFFNVLKGEMSVVGPRPHMLKHTEEYARIIDRFMVRHLVKPGITGWAQVTGFRGETKTPKDMENRVKKDMWYIEHWSFFLDMKIIFRTMINAVVGEEKAY